MPSQAIYLENSAIDSFIAAPSRYGSGPFCITEYSLAEKAGMRDPADYNATVRDLARLGVSFFLAPSPGQLASGAYDHGWDGPWLIPLDAQKMCDARVEIRTLFVQQSARLGRENLDRNAKWRSKLEEWAKDPTNRLDRTINGRRGAVVRGACPGQTQPNENASISARIEFALCAWEVAMTLVRLDEKADKEKDAKNDCIDGFHYAIASTFCRGILVRDQTLARIAHLMPGPRIDTWLINGKSGEMSLYKG